MEKKIKDKLYKIYSPKKEKEKSDNGIVTASEEVFRNFFLGDLLFTILPLVILIILSLSFGKLDFSFLFISEWPYTSIIISSLALVRFIELKVVYQKDTSGRAVALAILSVIFVILSVISLALYTINSYTSKIDENFVVIFQFVVLALSTLLLYCSHRYRERLLFEKRAFPKNISAREFHWYLTDALKSTRSNIRNTCAAFTRNYCFIGQDNDVEDIEEYGRRELERLIEDVQSDLSVLKERMEKWEKPPYSKFVPPDSSGDD